MTKIIFMGSADFSLPILRKLAENYSITAVVTQPDRPSGRGQTLTPPPVKILAQELGLECFQPPKLRAPESFAKLSAWNPDLIVVAAYGQILRQNVLDLPPLGCINVHASLLPRWRGAAPIQAALLHGDKISGITIMKMDAGIDTGEILSQRELEIFANDNAQSLTIRLAKLGADLLIETLPRYLRGEIIPIAQDSSLATYAPMLKKEDGLLDFSRSVFELERHVRAFYPWPGSYILWNEQPLRITQAQVEPDPNATPGKRVVINKKPALGARDGWLVIEQLQPAGKKVMTGDVFLRGARNWDSGLS